MAAEILGRKGVGYEIFETYHQLIKNRYTREVAQKHPFLYRDKDHS